MQKTNATGYCFKFFFTKIVNKPGVDAVKYIALYPKKRVGPAIFFFFLLYMSLCTINANITKFYLLEIYENKIYGSVQISCFENAFLKMNIFKMCVFKTQFLKPFISVWQNL